MAILNQQMQRVVEPGTFDIMIGRNASDTTTVPLEVVQ